MSNQLVFNPFTSSLDFVGGGQDLNFLDPVATESLLPTPALDGAICVVQATDQIYEYSTITGKWSNTTQKFIDLSSNTSSPNGMTSSIVANVNNVNETHLALTVADNNNPGIVSINAQTFAGAKNFLNNITTNYIDGLSGPNILHVGVNASTSKVMVGGGTTITEVAGNLQLDTVNPNTVLLANSSSNVYGQTLSNGQILIGGTGSAPQAAYISGTTSQITVTPGFNSITIGTPQNIATTSSPTFSKMFLTASSDQIQLGTSVNSVTINGGTSATGRDYTIPDVGLSGNFVMDTGNQTIAGNKTFSNNVLAPGIDSPSGGGTIGIGYTNASTINIGHSGSTVNIIGTTNTINVTNYNVSNKTMNLNTAGPAASGSGVGIEVQENSIITGYVNTSGDRNSWQLLAPNTAGVVTITPGVGGFTIDQGSHNPLSLSTTGYGVTLDAANQILSVQYATGALPGLVSTASQTFGGNKTFANQVAVSATSNQLLLGTTNILTVTNAQASSQTLTIPAITSSDTLSTLGLAQTFSGANTFSSPVTISAASNQLKLGANLTLSGSTAATRTYTIPDTSAASSFVMTDSAQTINGVKTHSSQIPITATTNQLVLGTTNTVTITAPAPAASVTYTIPDTAASSSFVMSDLAQTINGIKTFSSALTSSATTNQVAVGTGVNQLVINAATAAAARTYSVPDIGTTGSFAMAPNGDLQVASFLGANNQSVAANVTGALFSGAVSRSFQLYISVMVTATASLAENFIIIGAYNGTTWQYSYSATGDLTGVVFTVTGSGQLQYQSPSYAGFTSLKMAFRAITTGV